MFSVNGKVERLLLFDPLDTKRNGLPSAAPMSDVSKAPSRRVGGVGWTVPRWRTLRLIVHSTSLSPTGLSDIGRRTIREESRPDPVESVQRKRPIAPCARPDQHGRLFDYRSRAKIHSSMAG